MMEPEQPEQDPEQIIAFCADQAMRAVTRWFTDHIYDGTQETCLEFYVRNQVRAAQPPKPKKLKK